MGDGSQRSRTRFPVWSGSEVFSSWVVVTFRTHSPKSSEPPVSSSPTSVSRPFRLALIPDIFGGFLITKRMLDLFRRPTDPPDYAYLYAVPAVVFGGGFVWGASTGVAGLVQAGYFVSTLLSIGALSGLSSQVSHESRCNLSAELSGFQVTARAGNSLGMLGVFAGVLSTLGAVGFSPEVLGQFGALVVLGGGLGLAIGRVVTPMQLPQTVAALHSVVGLAAVMTSAGSVLASTHLSSLHLITAYLGVLIGGITFTGEREGIALLKLC